MYLPSWLNLTSEIDEMISEKNDRVDGSSSSSKPVASVKTSGNEEPTKKIELTFCVSITERGVTHVRKLDVGLGTRVHEQIAMCWMKLRGSDDFRQLLHVHRLDIHNI
jgi:hypothetical protein